MFISILLVLLFVGSPESLFGQCDQVKIESNVVSWGHKKPSKPRQIEAIIIHSSYNALSSDSFDVNGILEEYRAIDVAPHYIVGRDGTIYQLVPDQDIAYHAGKSHLPDSSVNVNATSIGIEIVNTEMDAPTERQYVSLAKLVKCLEEEYNVKYILGHSDIAPGRKTDPWNFDWKKFKDIVGKV